MKRLSSPSALCAELTSLLRYAAAPAPSRAILSKKLAALGQRLAARRDFPDGAGPSSPWGPAQSVYDLARGVRWVSCAGHGGLGVAQGIARRMLTPAARRHGELLGGYYWYEEDIAYAIPIFEVPEWGVALAHSSGGSHETREQLEKKLRHYFPRYFEMAGLADKPRLKPGMKLRCVNSGGYTGGVTPGSTWEVVKVTPSAFVAAKEGFGVKYKFRMNDWETKDTFEVA